MARYIDADELKERLEDFSKWCRDGRKQGVDFVLDCPLPDMPTADVVLRAEWISVEERLPDCEYGAETEALLFRLKTGTVEAGYFGTGGRFRDKYFRCYHHANEGWGAKDVTHWMPLPEPPKGN